MDTKNKNSNKEIAKTNDNNRNLGYFSPFFDSFFDFPSFRSELREMQKMMKTDVCETEDGISFEMELPGFQKKDIEIELKNGYLIVNAERSNNLEYDGKQRLKRERYYGSFSRSFYVGDINREEIHAKLDSGVLYISVPKHIRNENKNRIEIN